MLLDQRLKALESLRDPADLGMSGGDFADMASIEDRAFYQINDMTWQTVAQINRALERLEEGTYGICENCGQMIGENRLRALPFAGLCIPCKEGEERLGVPSSHGHSPVRLGTLSAQFGETADRALMDAPHGRYGDRRRAGGED